MNEYYDENFNGLDNKYEYQYKTFENCLFESCDFTETSLKDTHFSDCEFIECNFSIVDILSTRFNDILFTRCKLSGLDFTKANPFLLQISFDDCILSYCMFSQLKLNKSKFAGCKISGCDFIGASLVSADFTKAQFEDTIFDSTDLSKAIFTDAVGYNINPQNNKIKKAVFSMPEVLSLLKPLDIVIK